MMRYYVLVLVSYCTLALAGCGALSSSAATPPENGDGEARVRFADGAPYLQALVDGEPEDIGTAYLQFDSQTVASSFQYGTFTPFLTVPAGSHALTARDTLGYAVGPLPTGPLAAGARYTLIIVGTFPNYRVLAFSEPAAKDAQLSLYEASPATPRAAFGSFAASQHTDFKQLGSATLGNVTTADLGSSVKDFGGYAGTPQSQIGTYTPRQIDGFDTKNALPFHRVRRLSLFLFDSKPGTTIGPLFGSLDP